MPRPYTVVFENVTVVAAQDLFELTPADDRIIRILGWEIDNVSGTADAGDAQEEFIRMALIRGNATAGTGGTTATPAPVGRGESAAAFTAKVNNTGLAAAGAGTPLTLWAGACAVRMPGPIFLPPECWPNASQQDSTIVLRLLAAPADSINLSGTLWVEETG